MKPQSKSKPNLEPNRFAAARWILIVGSVLLLGTFTFTKMRDDQSERPKNSSHSSTEEAELAAAASSGGLAWVAPKRESPPWEAAKQKPEMPLPPGAIPASEVNPPPPDPNEPPPPNPVEPPNPATHRPEGF